MKRVAAVLAIVIGLAVTAANPATAAPVRYPNCKALNARYRGGVARVGAVDRRASGHAKYQPLRSNALYAANTKLDRDRDGIACER